MPWETKQRRLREYKDNQRREEEEEGGTEEEEGEGMRSGDWRDQDKKRSRSLGWPKIVSKKTVMESW